MKTKMQLSDSGLALLAVLEGFSATPYQCSAGIWTIGHGHVIRAGEHFEKITREEARAILRRDVAFAEVSVNSLITVDLSQNEYDALVLFAFNVGGYALKLSTLRAKLLAGDKAGAAGEFTRWNKARVNGVLKPVAGLTNRRNAEKDLFLAPIKY